MYKERTNAEWLDLKRRQIERFTEEFARQTAMRGGVYKRSELAHELGISGKNATSAAPITNYFGPSSTKPFPYYVELARLWGVRQEYLECKDDFRTETDILTAGGVANPEYIKAHFRILEFAGCTLVPHLKLHALSYKALSKNWEAIRETFTDEALSTVIDTNGTTFAEWDGTSPIDIELTNFIPVKKALAGHTVVEYPKSSYVCYPDEYFYMLDYEIVKGDEAAVMDVEQFEVLFSAIDNIVGNMAAGTIKQHLIMEGKNGNC